MQSAVDDIGLLHMQAIVDELLSKRYAVHTDMLAALRCSCFMPADTHVYLLAAIRVSRRECVLQNKANAANVAPVRLNVLPIMLMMYCHGVNSSIQSSAVTWYGVVASCCTRMYDRIHLHCMGGM
eukprot:20936-Heterococcus_DN1.PRE.3